MNSILLSSSKRSIFPPVPARGTVCGVNIRFQGLTITVDGISYPWFETAFQCLNSSQRNQVYAQKRPDTHIILEFLPGGSIYDEPGQPFQNFISPNFEANPSAFLGLVEEVILNGYTPGIVFNGDNGDNPNDGYPNALRQLPILVNLLKTSRYGDINPYVLYLRFWDGVFYGSTPSNIQNFGTQFRQLLPNGYLGIEHNIGHIPVGNGPSDYAPGGMMDGYDVVFSEYANGLPHDDSTWQITARLIKPYNRPPDQPSGDDPNPPFYLVDSPRGSRYHCAFEFDEYRWVRSQVTAATIQTERNYLFSLGCKYTG